MGGAVDAEFRPTAGDPDCNSALTAASSESVYAVASTQMRTRIVGRTQSPICTEILLPFSDPPVLMPPARARQPIWGPSGS